MGCSFLDSTREMIQQKGWKRLLLAVSGGLDSICLAHYFICNQETLGIEWLGIAHVHHGLRECTADLDAELVEQFAKAQGVPFFRKNLDGSALKDAEGSLEENARKARYDALSQIIAEIKGRSRLKAGMTKCEQSGMTKCEQSGMTNPFKIDAILTAHHAGDQAETMYMRLRRGVTMAGLTGISVVRKSCTVSPAIFRPFLNVSRGQLLEYARQNNLKWREDESNSDTRFTRNLIRHTLLPNLEQNIPEAAQQLCRIATLASTAYNKTLAAADILFTPLIVPRSPLPQGVTEEPDEVAKCTKVLVLDTRKGKVSLSGGKDEILRLWLDKLGFRFPVGTFKGKALLNDLRNLSYRSRFIVKKRHIIWICDKTASMSL
ncbi:MAG: tRNA lysidine(34) synthetase TilS [Fibrobacter sp.]|nr:tRNA lysidine(34) synthetase TilS [Fibrobacter sp.]